MEARIVEVIRSRPGRRISYHEFMELALYDPAGGYYMRPVSKVGKDGDFYTSANTGSAFGTTLGKWAAGLSSRLGLKPNITEIGGGTGKLAYDVLSAVREHAPDLFPDFSYTIIEVSPYHQELQKEKLKEFPGVRFERSLDFLERFEGIVLANELYDAFPVHMAERKDGIIYEAFIGEQDGRLCEMLLPLTDPEMARFLEQYRIRLPEGFRTEVPMAMAGYAADLARRIKKGIAVTFDYGYTGEEWLEPEHRRGSLRGYTEHRMEEDALKHPGEMDLTSHIRFDVLEASGRSGGLVSAGLYRQDEFLLKAGILEELSDHDGDPFSEAARKNRSVRSLIMPGGISAHFRVLIQTKGLEDRTEKLFPNPLP